ncbi:MAG TPA: alanine--glyoxylate aminotransferase family protein [Alphaproteobacteria bacterium]|nr:alanine--glyoxylate aminotransferase family protein [Alphaproteobacteria bacterium]
MHKRHLFAPGPTSVPPEILLEIAKPVLHHREPEFIGILAEVREGLRYLFQTTTEVVILGASGTGAMEAAVANLFAAGDHALVISGGKFGERWAEICRAYQVAVTVLEVPWGEAVNPAEVRAALERDPSIRGVCVQACETSTGVAHDVQALGEIVRAYPQTLLVVDAVSALGAVELPMDAWGLDAVVAGSQKAMMLPPGLAFVALSDKAWQRASQATLPRYYFDLWKIRRELEQNDHPYTLPTSLVVALREALRRIRAEGLDRIVRRHRHLAEATRAAMRALGLSLLPSTSPSDALTVVRVPEGLDGARIPRAFQEQFNITIVGGQDRLRGKVFRLAHMGYVDTFDVVTMVAAVELVLQRLGYAVELGAGVRAAQEVLAKAVE